MADYTPTLGDYTELKPFRFWCQKVLPLVYDDSLSYYELLCKVVDYLNKTMEDVDTLHDDVVNLHTAYTQLQTYVNTYFDNLDVQNEINEKLDAMAADGSLNNIIEPFIPGIVSAWLSEHITPTTPVIDSSLSISGAGADAKITGDRVDAMLKLTKSVLLQTTYGAYIDNTTQTVNLTPIEYENYAYAVDNCEPGDIYTIYGRGSGGAPWLYTFIDENNARVAYENSTNVFTGLKAVAPYNAKKIVFGFYTTAYPDYQVYKQSKTTCLDLDYNAVEIPQNSDFNDYVDAGNYVVTSGATAQTIQNCPVGVRGRLFPLKLGSTLPVIQIYITPEPNIYYRVYDAGHFNAWDCLTNNDALLTEFSTGITKIIPEAGYIATNSVGNTLSLTPVQSSYYTHVVTDCSEGDEFIIKGQGASSGASLWCFVDSNNTVLTVCNNGVGTNNDYIKLTAPTNASKIISNNQISANSQEFYKKVSCPTDAVTFKFFKEQFEYGSYDHYGAFSFNNAAISTIDFIPEEIIGFTSNTNDIKVRISCWNKDGTSADYYEYSNGTTFMFNHARYNYKITIRTIPLDSIFNIDPVIEKITLYTNKKNLLGICEDLYREKTNLEKMVAGIGESILMLMKNDYKIEYANARTPISIDTYDGSGQVSHPKVLYFPNKFGGHKFWMCYTPCPFTSSYKEHPCIAYSDDGYTWTNIPNNPIITRSNHAYDSDPHLVYRPGTGKLECWWRYVGDYDDTPVPEIIYRKISSDGITWGQEEELRSNTSGNYDKYLSPSVIWDGSKYRIWCVNTNASPARIDYYETSTGSNWTFVRSFTLTYTDDDDITYTLPWHMDAIYNDNKYIMVVMCKHTSDDEFRNRWTTFLATSNDNITYDTPRVVIYGNKGHWDAFMYRPAIVYVEGIYRIYYAAESGVYGAGSGGADVFYNIGITESDKLEDFVGNN